MRLDIFLKEREQITRSKATRYIENGQVTVNGRVICKAGHSINATDTILLQKQEINFVSQGGYKLLTALQTFKTSVEHKVFADIGASTGGFTDCLLQFGAKKVYTIDVGENQLDSSLKADTRVVILDNCNARTLTQANFEEELDGIVIDVSFISLKHILPIVANLLQADKELYALIKPQFETEGKALNKHGIVKEKRVRHSVVEEICAFAKELGLYVHAITTAPIYPQKNIEYIAYFQKERKSNFALQNLEKELN